MIPVRHQFIGTTTHIAEIVPMLVTAGDRYSHVRTCIALFRRGVVLVISKMVISNYL